MSGTLTRAFGYQDDHMNLPVASVAEAAPFYEKVLGFRVTGRSDAPLPHIVLARDQVEIGLVESGGDPTQDGCAFHVHGLAALYEEFRANGLPGTPKEFSTEKHGDDSWRVFYVVAPDGLCFWFGERQA